MNRDAVVTINDLTSRDSVDVVCENINKYEATETLHFLATQYRKSLKLGGGSKKMAEMIALIGDGIAARDLEAFLLK